MIEWPLILGSGMLGAAHCLGMCGPFALAVGAAAPSWRANLWRQAWYSAGRVFTYAVLGSAAAFGGRWLAGQFAVWANIPAILALVAGCFLVIQGLLAAGVLPKKGRRISWGLSWCSGLQGAARGAGQCGCVSGRDVHRATAVRPPLRHAGAGREHPERASWPGDHGGLWAWHCSGDGGGWPRWLAAGCCRPAADSCCRRLVPRAHGLRVACPRGRRALVYRGSAGRMSVVYASGQGRFTARC